MPTSPGGLNRDKLLKGTNERNSHVRRFSHVFALIFVCFMGITAFGGHRFSQKTAGNRRISQKTATTCRNPYAPFSLSLLVPP